MPHRTSRLESTLARASRRRWRRALLLALLVGFGCGEPRVSITVVGIDGATWRIINPLLARGDLPHLAKLIERGVRAPLRSEAPLFSPPIWTTIATGVSREEHGIERFAIRDGELVSASHRRAPALWNLLSRAGLRTAVVGWWGTYPAESIDGVIISERALKTREVDLQGRFAQRLRSPELSRLTHPPDVLERLADTLFEMPTRDPGDGEEDWLRKRVRSEDRAAERALVRLRRSDGPFDLELLLLRGVDPISHVFWRHVDPEAPVYRDRPQPSAAERARHADAVPAQYRLADALLGELVEGAPERLFLVISDHGFEAVYDQTPKGMLLTGHHHGPAGMHGIFVAAGGPIRAGALPSSEVSIYDIAPSILHLLGIEVARTLPGRSLQELYEPAWLEQHPMRGTDRYAGPAVDLDASEQSGRGDAEVDERLRNELRSLGYIE